MGWNGHPAPVQSVDAKTVTLNAWLQSVSLLHAKRSVTTQNCALCFDLLVIEKEKHNSAHLDVYNYHIAKPRLLL